MDVRKKSGYFLMKRRSRQLWRGARFSKSPRKAYSGSVSHLAKHIQVSLTSPYWIAREIVPTAAIATPDAESNGGCDV